MAVLPTAPWAKNVFDGPTGPAGPAGPTGPAGSASAAIFVPPGLATATTLISFYTPGGFSVGANGLALVTGGNVTASDTDYWTFAIGHGTSGSPTTVLTITTKTLGSGGTGNLTGGTIYSLTHSGFSVAAAGIGFVTATPTGTPETVGKLFIYRQA